MTNYPRTLFYLIDVLCNEKCSKCGHWKYNSQKTIEGCQHIVNFINAMVRQPFLGQFLHRHL